MRIYKQMYPNPDPESAQRLISFVENQYNKTYSNVFYRNYSLFNSDRKNFLVNAIKTDESLTNYGAKSKNMQYISNQERSTFNIPKDYAANYNFQLPHYQYAYALFAKDMKGFLQPKDERGVELSHNTMHNNFGYLLQDATYSVTSLLFYPYHSWIDAMIQFKIRRSTKEDIHYLKTHLNSKFAHSTKIKLQEVFHKIS